MEFVLVGLYCEEVCKLLAGFLVVAVVVEKEKEKGEGAWLTLRLPSCVKFFPQASRRQVNGFAWRWVI